METREAKITELLHSAQEGMTLSKIEAHVKAGSTARMFYQLNKLIKKGTLIREGKQYKINTLGMEYVEIPFYGQGQAGINGKFFDDSEKKFMSLHVNSLAHNKPNDLFLMQVSGDSMQPTIPDHSLILCKKWHGVNFLKDKTIVVCSVQNEIKIKRFINVNDRVYLMSDNPKYQPILFDSTSTSDTIHGLFLKIIG
ncbi:MAG: S24 family peptidase [Methylacidiphilales bacterium]|nr:S24 family peptidase [Candidatus Methylacidiphilales bacterium]